MAKEKKSQTRVKTNQKLYKDGIITESYIINKFIIFLLIISLLINFFTAYHFFTFNHNKEQIKKVEKEKIVTPENILFLGDSITDYYNLETYFPNNKVVNSGVSGNTTQNILDDMKNRIYIYNPSKVFLLIGTNDLDLGKKPAEIVENIKLIINGIKENRSSAEIYIESIYPVNKNIKKNNTGKRDNKDIKEINKELEKYCEEKELIFIDTYKELADEEENLKEDYTEDGLHLSEEGYQKVTEKLINYI